MAFNGSGTFNRLYSWVQDAANGINIDSTRMDNEMNGMATALSDCVTRDGQSPFTANIPAGGFKITGLGPGVAGTDAANINNVNAVAGNQWIAELNSVAWVTGSSFKVLGANVTANYTAGRRLKITHNTGGTTTYATVVSSSFSTDTTVTVATDGAVSLVSTVTAVSYGLLSYSNPAYLDPRSAVAGYLSTFQSYTTAPSLATINLDTTLFDAQSEFNTTTHLFTAQHAGYYWVCGRISVISASVVANTEMHIVQSAGQGITSLKQIPAGKVQQLESCGLLVLAKGETVKMQFLADVSCTIEGLSTGNTAYDTSLSIGRLA